ncbi:MAG: stage II sporulation protein M [Planctomycetota bacterium]
MSDPLTTPWSVQFRRERQAAWMELENLVTRSEKQGLRSLGGESVARLPVLYRAALSSLGVARSSVLDHNLRLYLEALVARAYLVVYAPERGVVGVATAFVLHGFPRAVRSIVGHVAVAAGLVVLGAAIAWAMVAANADHFYLFVDPDMASGRDPVASTENLRRTLFSGHEDQSLLTFATFLFTHNSSVGILAYGLGFVLGLPVVLLLLYNGMMLGAMSALFHERGLGVEWWSWVAPHGVTELTAIVLCGAAGLAIAGRVVFPGRQSRLQALAEAGRRMGGVVAGSVVMLLLAALVEGVFRQIVTHVPTRYAMATTFALLWAAYFLAAGRRGR